MGRSHSSRRNGQARNGNGNGHRVSDRMITVQEKDEPRVVIIGLELPEDRQGDFDESMDELAALVKTAGGRVVGRASQKRAAIDPSYYLGKGKAEEVRELCNGLQAELVIANNNLTPSQARALDKVISKPVMDRTELILKIFADNAQTHQARVQVDLAQAQYELPRLKRMWTHLHREKGGGAFRGGAGERQIELDRRMVRKRITDHKKELERIRERKARTIFSRRELFTVAIVGYTNAGKSTLMNRLTDAGVLQHNKLFSTLDTRTRVWELGGHHRCLISDTVGFIRRLPHELVEAFYATLEEAMNADLLLHVVDTSAREPERQIEAVNEVLRELHCEQTETLMVFNKVDRMRERGGDLSVLHNLYPGAVEVSAAEGIGIEDLNARVRSIMAAREVEIDLEVDARNGKLMSFLRAEAGILEERWDDAIDHMRIRVDPRHLKKIEEMRLPNGHANGHHSAGDDDPDPHEEEPQAPIDAYEPLGGGLADRRRNPARD